MANHVLFVRAFHNTKANYVSNEILFKFNNTLRKLCIAKAVYTIPVDSYQDSRARCFDYDGKTQMSDGFELLWHDVIKGLKKHDENDKHAEVVNIIHENTKHQQSEKLGNSRAHKIDWTRHNESRDWTGKKGGCSRSRDFNSDQERYHRSPHNKYNNYHHHDRGSRREPRI